MSNYEGTEHFKQFWNLQKFYGHFDRIEWKTTESHYSSRVLFHEAPAKNIWYQYWLKTPETKPNTTKLQYFNENLTKRGE